MQGGTQGGATHCDLFVIGRMQGVNTSIVEGQDSIRIVMTTSDQAQVNKLRQRGRDYVNKSGKTGGMSGQQGGDMPQGTQQGGSPPFFRVLGASPQGVLSRPAHPGGLP